MQSNERDLRLLRHIVEYCNQIGQTHEEYCGDRAVFDRSATYRNAIALCVLQIGELVSILSDEFKAVNTQMPWRDIKAMRNVVAHRYGVIDTDILWNTTLEDIPALHQFCIAALGGEAHA